ncbi:MAG: VOC family protein [Solirubrobacteraceae bacterium]|nr:VOC family protein [Solirubrobacteraceae bacterium]
MSTQEAITVLRLRERATLDWLERAFGFALSEVTEGDDGGLAHAQLRWGDSWLMASTGGRIDQPTGAASVYLTVADDEDVDAAYTRAMAEPGAVSVLEPEDMPYGGRNASIADPDGNVWSVGSYHPRS